MTPMQAAITGLLKAIADDTAQPGYGKPFWAIVSDVAEKHGLDVDELHNAYQADMERWADGD